MISFIIDGTNYGNICINTEDLKSSITRGNEFSSLLISQDMNLEFSDPIYSLFWTRFQDSNNNGFCDILEIEILDDCSGEQVSVYKGILKISDMTFNHRTCIAKCKVFDDSYSAFLENNDDLEIFISESTRTKNGNPIIDLDVYDVTCFDPSTGAWFPNDAKCYKLDSVFSYVISYVSDGEVGYKSDWIANSGLFITIEPGIWNIVSQPSNNPSNMVISLRSLIEELNKRVFLGFAIEQNDDNEPILRIEPKEFFFNGSIASTLDNSFEVKSKIDKQALKAGVRVGTKETEHGSAFAFPEGENLYGFQEVAFQNTGQCNVDQLVDLVTDWIYSSNVLENVMTGGTDYEGSDEIFVIECQNVDDVAKTADARPHDMPNLATIPSNRFYNITYNNINTLNRLYGFMHGTLQGESIDPDDQFKAGTLVGHVFSNDPAFSGGGNWSELYVTTSPTFSTGFPDYLDPANFPNMPPDPFPWDQENNDPNGNYDPVNYEYIVPVNGSYDFSCYVPFQVTLSHPFQPCLRMAVWGEFVLMDSTGTTIKETFMQRVDLNSTGLQPRTFSGSFNCIAGDRVHMRFYSMMSIDVSQNCIGTGGNPNKGWEGTIWLPGILSHWRMTGGKLFNDLNLKRVVEHETEIPITATQWRAMVDDPGGKISLNSYGKSYDGWIKKATYSHADGLLKLKLIANS